MLDQNKADTIGRAVEDGFDAQIAFTQDLIRFPSMRGQEHDVQDFVFDALKERGYATTRLHMDQRAIEAHEGGGKFSAEHSDAPIVIGTFTPSKTLGRSLILQSHTDVVPAGPHEMWRFDPFDPQIDGDWLYGRGGADMKAGHAAMIFAMDALRAAGLVPAARVEIQSVVEEESTGNGALMTYLARHTADAVLIPEPEEEMLVRANVGTLWFSVELRGTPVHVREMGAGANAIDAAYRVIQSLRTLEARWNNNRHKHKYFNDLSHPINLNIGKIEGGDWGSSVPAWCRIQCRIAIYPGIKAADAANDIEAHLTEFAKSDNYLSDIPPKITFNGFFAEGYVQPPGSEAEAVLDRAHRAATGAPLQSFTTPGYLDCRVYRLYNDIPSLCYGPISENIHGFDERVSLQSLKRITTTMALFIADWCGTTKI
ncbi:MAG: ArgE/DapE family deacylase [Marivita sp.]|uniref:ArgE/DapE family deacylase n=1 Tax=Marivita sp. TaxID=2003365 RepID=UPI003EF10E70